MNPDYFLPEWAPVRAVLMAWPYPHGDWRNNIAEVNTCYWHMLAAFSQRLEVWLLLHPSIPEAQWREAMPDLPICWERVVVCNDILYNDTWIRDYGPISLATGYLTFGFNGWGGKYPAQYDNAVAAQLLPRQDLTVTTVPFICEGGALETNGRVLLVNRDCVVDEHRNPGVSEVEITELLTRQLGLEKICWLADINLTNDDTDGHIDTIVRFLSEDVLVYSGRNNRHPDHAMLDSLHRQVNQLAEAEGWALFELPTPMVQSRLDKRLLPATYANFLILNDSLFVPVYGVEEDRDALRVFACACPQFRLVPIRAEALLEQHGSLHCATMQVAWL